jgi:hypothetical protein
VRLLILIAVPLVAAGCGSSTEATSPARPQTSALNWVETAGRPGERLVIRVTSLTLGLRRWSVRASITNDTSAQLFIGKPHSHESGAFGLLTATAASTGLTATRYAPPLPSALRPGETWNGRFGGSGTVGEGRPVRVVFGTFWAYGGVRVGGWRRVMFRLVTDHAFRP